MKAQFFLGRSGSGKTHYCIAQIQEELRREPEGDPLLLLVPEQATFQMEQAILADPELRGFHRVSVLSFDRLARTVLLERSASLLPVLSESGRQMVLQRLLQEHGGELEAFSRSGRSTGFVVKLAEMIRECRHYQKRADQLLDQAAALRDEDVALAEKLHDLGTLLGAYEGTIEGRYLDPDDFLDLVCERVGGAAFLQRGRLWIDGFAGFTPQQYGVLGTLTEKVCRVHVSLCLDPASESFARLRDGVEDEGESFDLFQPISQTWSRLRQMFGDVGSEMESAVCFPLEKGMPRFAHSSSLARLEAGLFVPRKKGDAFSEVSVEEVVVVRAADRRGEVEAVAQRILYLCREKGHRYRDMAVILRDFSDYQPLLEAVFSDYGIAYFMDQRRSVAHHPLVGLLRSLLEVMLDDLSNASIFDYLKSDLVSPAREPLNHLENVILSQGVRLRRWAEHGRGPDDAEARGWCERMVRPLIELHKALGDGENRVGAITRLLYGFLEKLEVGQRLGHWAKEAENEGRLDLAYVHQQVYEQVIGLLEELVEVLGDDEVSLAEYGELLETVLGQVSLAMVPPSLDQVLVGTIERSRHPQLRAAFVLGVNEGRFPQVAGEDAFLSDDQRDRLCQRGFELAPGRTRRLLDERFLGYIALTRPRDFLWVSYATADAKGKLLNPSLLIDAIGDAVGEAVFVDLALQRGEIYTRGQLAERLAEALSDESLEAGEKLFWQGLGRWGLGYWAALKDALGGLVYRNEARLDGDLVGRFFGSEVAGSISRLESFSACGYRHFSNYLLGIQERKELKLQMVDLGSFYHEALHEIFVAMQEQGTGWLELEFQELEGLARSVTEGLLTGEGDYAALVNQSYRNRMILGRAAKTFGELCQALRASFEASGFEQVESELTFGPGEKIEGLVLLDRYVLRGKIDRVDVCRGETGDVGLSLVDYKRSAKAFDYAQYYHGLALQLLSYLLVLEANYPVKGAGAMAAYVPLEVAGEKGKGDVPIELLEQANREKGIRPRKANGVIDEGWFGQLDRQVSPGSYSQFYSVRVLKDGECYTKGNKSIVNREELEQLLGHGYDLLTGLVEALLAGDISIAPFRYKNETACDHCCYKSLCRFDPLMNPYRLLASMEKDDVLDELGGGGGQ
jgi:ATP-dependent helicase/nuclease subunit B